MNFTLDREFTFLLAAVGVLLIFASFAGWMLARKVRSEKARETVENLRARTNAWWGMVIIFTLAMMTGGVGSIILFGLTSFWALREFITLTPTRRGDHRTLFWVFFIITPLHYYILYINWYGLFIVFIPVYAFLLVPMRSVVTGDCERFLERTAKIQWALMICVYCVSHAPAILSLEIPGYEGQNGKLLFWFVLVAQMSDVLQYIWGKTLGRHKIAPTVSPNKTWEGFIGGTISASFLGMALYWVTPFTPWVAFGMASIITFMGFFGGLTMSAIKRDRGIKDFGSAIAGHGGVLDRIDSLCFAAPVFFHVARFYYT